MLATSALTVCSALGGPARPSADDNKLRIKLLSGNFFADRLLGIWRSNGALYVPLSFSTVDIF